MVVESPTCPSGPVPTHLYRQVLAIPDAPEATGHDEAFGGWSAGPWGGRIPSGSVLGLLLPGQHRGQSPHRRLLPPAWRHQVMMAVAGQCVLTKRAVRRARNREVPVMGRDIREERSPWL
jgi:hypothetical protein